MSGLFLSPCDDCVYKAVRIAGKCSPLLCVYGALNNIAKMLNDHDLCVNPVYSRPTFIVGADDECRDEKLERVLELQKESQKINDELYKLKSELDLLPE